MKRSSETSSTGDEAAPPPRVVHTVPLAEEGDGGEDGERDEVAVDAEDDLVHAHVEDGLGEDMVAAVGDHDEDHPGVRPPPPRLVVVVIVVHPVKTFRSSSSGTRGIHMDSE